MGENTYAGPGPFGRGSFWALLARTEREALRRIGTLNHHPAGITVLREGDPAGSVLILLAGRVKVVATTPRGNPALLAIRGPGDILGELSAVVGKRRLASVVTVDPVDVLRLPGERFDRVMAQNPTIVQAVLRVMSHRLHDDNARRAVFADSTTAQRLEVLLADLAEQYGSADGSSVQITLPFSQEDLAGLIDASREAVVRALRTLRAKGIVRTDRQRITVLRPDELRLRAESR